jgi:N-acetylglucosamine-6-phosphate deacetylase
MSILAAPRILATDGPTWVAIENGLIAEVGYGITPSDATDLGDVILAPGFVDIQINGFGDIDFSHTDPDGYARAEQLLLAHGVTTFLPTLITAPMDAIEAATEVLSAAGAFGVHLEGPFLGGAPGAHQREWLCEADVGWMSSMLERFPGFIRVVTLAPEVDEDAVLAEFLAKAGVIASLGHSVCGYDEARAFADAGASAVTHLFNAMSGLHHRAPGLAGAALDDDRLTPSLIADLIHVHPAMLRLAAQRKRNVALVSDAIGIDAEWARERGVREFEHAPRLPDGTLAGSTLTLDQAVRNCVSIGIDIARAVEMASTIPSELLGLDDRGTIAVGKRADLVALDTNDLSVRAVWKHGVQSNSLASL